MKTVFIINPAAGNGNALKKWRSFEQTVQFPFEAMFTETKGHAISLAKTFHASKERVLLIGFGGDGTLREIIAGAAGAENLIVGAVAAGSGNDFSRGYAAFRDADAIMQFFEHPTFVKEDLGEFSNGAANHFVSSSGIGFDAEISVLVNRSPAKKWLNKIGAGKIVYLLYVIRTLVNFKGFQLVVEEENHKHVFDDVWFATVSNQPYFGGGMKISPRSKTNDGLLELTVVHNLSRLKLLLVFGTVFTGTHTRFKEVAQLSRPEFRLTVNKAVFRHVDGDNAGTAPRNQAVTYAVSKQYWQSVNIEKKEEV
ncbi:diacylglycerol kinase family protein [Planomicrobium sp. CPCC 101079]|uniref:diacylglycerol/lipid kinase family protein n=1 Tax=Planomicrobium sp. CPCC 101079 TaxID=2599618 RepID=UPI0011B37F9A|nr:YegS/Rv2252/BmrU family lipid kinase [Planomicrobium sp. CPCC 101079]TWT12491.1 YegS/Rv2252/BmrU family lipid kinase [Planomicrobium sp. CPCC 101079]